MFAVTLVLAPLASQSPLVLPSPRGRWLRRWSVRIALAAGALVVAYQLVAPLVVAREVHDQLGALGFPEARLHVASVGLDHVRLTGVELADGLALGEVELDAGVSSLWRGGGPDEVTIRGARVSTAALARLPSVGGGVGGRGAAASPASSAASSIERVRVEDSVLSLAGGAVSITADITLPTTAPLAYDVTARTAAWKLGSTTVHDVVITARDRGHGVRACARGRIGGAAIEACTSLPSSVASAAGLRALRAVDVTWSARSAGESLPAWTGTGRGRIAWTPDGPVTLEDGHAEIDVAAGALGPTTIERATIAADLEGRLSELELGAIGEVRTTRLRLGDGAVTATFDDVALPFDLRLAAPGGEVGISNRGALEARAVRGTLAIGDESIEVSRPEVMLRDDGAAPVALAAAAIPWPRPLKWRAAEATWSGAHFRQPSGAVELADATTGGVHTLAWVSERGPGLLALDAGDAAFSVEDGAVHVAGARVAAQGGELTLDPVVIAPHGATELMVRAHGLEVARIAPIVSRGAVEGSGLLDGEMRVRVGGGPTAIGAVALVGRGGGWLRLTDAAWRERLTSAIPELAIHRRVAGALADFAYTRFVAALGPPGSDPELRVSLRGRGKHVNQELDLDVNLRNVRATVDRVIIGHDEGRSRP